MIRIIVVALLCWVFYYFVHWSEARMIADVCWGMCLYAFIQQLLDYNRIKIW